MAKPITQPEREKEEEMKIRFIDPMDYFNKYGFKDGDCRRLRRVAVAMLPIVKKLLNEEFERQGLGYRAVECDISSSHNMVRMQLIWNEGKEEKSWGGVPCKEFPKGVEEVIKKVGHVPVQ